MFDRLLIWWTSVIGGLLAAGGNFGVRGYFTGDPLETLVTGICIALFGFYIAVWWREK